MLSLMLPAFVNKLIRRNSTQLFAYNLWKCSYFFYKIIAVNIQEDSKFCSSLSARNYAIGIRHVSVKHVHNEISLVRERCPSGVDKARAPIARRYAAPAPPYRGQRPIALACCNTDCVASVFSYHICYD